VRTDELSSIPGLADKHLRVLARQQVTDFRSFADADQRDIYRSMANIRPRPSLGLISQWQEQARRRLRDPSRDTRDDVSETDATGWQTVASFAVIFSQRQAGLTWERRVEAERTEVEPEQERQTWAGWDIGTVGSWMASHVNPAGDETSSAQPGEPERPQDAEPAQAADDGAPERIQLSIVTAAIVAADRTFDLISGGALVGEPPAELTAPVRVVFTVSGAQAGTAVQAVTRVLRPDAPGWNPQAPVALQRSGQAEFDLAGVPAGHYELSLIAWAPDATAKPVSVRLPALAIR
jgi:hypothetical protein